MKMDFLNSENGNGKILGFQSESLRFIDSQKKPLLGFAHNNWKIGFNSALASCVSIVIMQASLLVIPLLGPYTQQTVLLKMTRLASSCPWVGRSAYTQQTLLLKIYLFILRSCTLHILPKKNTLEG